MRAEKVLADIIKSAIGAKTHFDMWWAQASEARSEMEDAIDGHRDFFAASYDAHYTAFFIYLAHLFDRRDDSSSIRRYLALHPRTLDDGTHQILANEYAALLTRAEPLITARHKTVAHIDARLTEKDVFEPLNITWDEVRAILADTIALVVRLCGASSPGDLGIPRDGRLREATFLLLESIQRNRTA